MVSRGVFVLLQAVVYVLCMPGASRGHDDEWRVWQHQLHQMAKAQDVREAVRRPTHSDSQPFNDRVKLDMSLAVTMNSKNLKFRFRQYYEPKAERAANDKIGRTHFKRHEKPKQKEPEVESPMTYYPQGTDPCDKYDVDGCSIPFGAPFFFKSLFTPSCNRHDICYHCGVKYGVTRVQCDRGFHHDMKNACIAKYLNETAPSPHQKQVVLEALERHQEQFDDIISHAIKSGKNSSNAHDEEAENKVYVDIAESIHSDVVGGILRVLLQEVWRIDGKLRSPSKKISKLINDKKSLKYRSDKPEMDNKDILELRQKFCEEVLLSVKDIPHSIDLIPTCKEVELISCYFFDFVYFLAVRIFAGSSYLIPAESFCGEAFVKKCLPPIPTYIDP